MDSVGHSRWRGLEAVRRPARHTVYVWEWPIRMGMTPAPVGRTTLVRSPAGAQMSIGLEPGRGGLGVAGVGDDQPVSSGSASS